MPDFSRAGSEGNVPDGFAEWQRGVTYTVRPALLGTLTPGRHYRLNVTSRRSHPRDLEFIDYASLYRRVTELAAARVAIVGSRNDGLHTWILAHAWFRQDAGRRSFVAATVTQGIVVATGGLAPRGEEVPSADALSQPGGQPQETFAARHINDAGDRHLDEIYSEFDMREGPATTGDLTVSYGEYTAEGGDVDFQPCVRRAERLAAFYRQSLTGDQHAERTPLPIVMREWTCLDTSKSRDRRIITVHLFLRS